MATVKGCDPETWGGALPRPPLLDLGMGGGRLRRWRDTGETVEQPALNQHYLALHLGGPKRVSRRGEGASSIVDAAVDSVTVVPAGAGYRWRTEGPIDYAHLYIDPDRLRRSALETFGRELAGDAPKPAIGRPDPLLGPLLHAMLEAGRSSPIYREMLWETLLATLAAGELEERPATLRLAPARLRRVCDLVEARLGDPLTLGDLAGAAGLSRHHFLRAFRATTGVTPCAYLLDRRIAAAKRLLAQGDDPIATVAARCGFGGGASFAAAFRRITGVSPGRWRAAREGV